jgi:hypothetical protein
MDNNLPISIRMKESLVKTMEASFNLANVKSRSEYISKAVQFYNAYLLLDGNSDVFSEVIGNVVKTKIDFAISNSEESRKKDNERIKENQFKLATQIAKINYIIADNLEIPEDKQDEWHIKAIDEVSKTKGTI